MNPLVIAVDPGGRNTGVVVRSGDALHYQALVTRDKTAMLDWYLFDVVDTVTKAKDASRSLAVSAGDLFDTVVVVAVEDLNDPTPQMGVTSVRGIVDTAQVIGAISGHWPIVRIPPGGHGSHPLAVYPSSLVGVDEKKGRGKLRHVRAAWDIAYAARLQLAIQKDPDT